MRSEPPELARTLDAKIKNNWMGHPHFYVADNSRDFRSKIDKYVNDLCDRPVRTRGRCIDTFMFDRLPVLRVISSLCNFIGEDTANVTKRKFLVTKVPSDDLFPVKTEVYVVYESALSPFLTGSCMHAADVLGGARLFDQCKRRANTPSQAGPERWDRTLTL